MAEHACVDCRALPPEEQPKRPRKIVSGVRKPRCWSHDAARRVHVKARTRERYLGNTYSLPPGFYDALYEAQGGRCAWCRKASGATKALAVDHDHRCCPGSTSCGKCARGLLCGECNQFISQRMGDDPEACRRGARYLEQWPAQQVWMAWGGEPA